MALEPVDGGQAAAPGTYQVLSQQPTVLVQTDGTVVDAVTVRALEKTYGVEYTFTKSVATWQGALFQLEAANLASDIAAIAAHDHVQALYSAQDTDANGFLRDYLFVTVVTDDGQNEAVVKLLQDTANSVSGLNKIDAAYNTLIKNLNSGG